MQQLHASSQGSAVVLRRCHCIYPVSCVDVDIVSWLGYFQVSEERAVLLNRTIIAEVKEILFRLSKAGVKNTRVKRDSAVDETKYSQITLQLWRLFHSK